MDGSAGVRTFRSPESQRLDAFVDAAFAFAVSLLIIGGTEPLRSFADLAVALARIPAFVFGFALIALFWLAHRTWSNITPVRTGRMPISAFISVVWPMPFKPISATISPAPAAKLSPEMI